MGPGPRSTFPGGPLPRLKRRTDQDTTRFRPGRRRTTRMLELAAPFALDAGGVAIARPGGTILGFDPSGPGDPGLAKVGPVNPQTGFPDWYKDKHGVTLEPCLDPKDAMCIMGAVPNPDAPLNLDNPDPAKNNFPDEFSYQAASSGLDSVGAPDARGRAGKGSLPLALEGAFLNGPPKPGDQMVFARFRARVTSGLTSGATYKVVTPYGTS